MMNKVNTAALTFLVVGLMATGAVADPGKGKKPDEMGKSADHRMTDCAHTMGNQGDADGSMKGAMKDCRDEADKSGGAKPKHEKPGKDKPGKGDKHDH